MEEKRKISCIVCPLSCLGEVTFDAGEIKDLSGFTCQRGKDYAREEVTAPKRMLTTTVRVINGKLPLLPVVSATPLPKDMVAACARLLAGVTVTAPIQEGDVICENPLGLGTKIVASRGLDAV